MGFLAPLATTLATTAAKAATTVVGTLAGAPQAIGQALGKTGTTILSGFSGSGPVSGAVNAAGANASGSLIADQALITGATTLAGKALQPPKPPPPPQPPNIASSLTRIPGLLSPTEGSFNGTFVSGSNRASNISGGKKTLLGG